ncbi:MAG: sigma-70 family RNA polymerase sigma factor [Phycisphaerales bacterium]|nr:sigma-70 family RNA polymerase sigma factor [Phycisphaerae bacterium]NNF43537.1 sigma-70 family RNA polymerase sigma factor [Phycisphaerales bacterium]NNM25034.1 sigma-70 family RNA polymerase sigma factor [Phycisphaerales bacterium]
MADLDVTRLLQSLTADDQPDHEALLALIHAELKVMAQAQMRAERPGHTLQPTALVNEAYLRLVQGTPRWECRAHFFAAAAEAMRRILIDHARQRQTLKRGGDVASVTFDDLDVDCFDKDIDVLSLDEALTALRAFDGRLAEIVRLRCFAGLSLKQVAELQSISVATVKRDWIYARAWLLERLGAC